MWFILNIWICEICWNVKIYKGIIFVILFYANIKFIFIYEWSMQEFHQPTQMPSADLINIFSGICFKDFNGSQNQMQVF